MKNSKQYVGFQKGSPRQRWQDALPILGLVLSGTAFGLDLLLPLGAALGPWYVLAILTTYRHPTRQTVGLAILSTFMIIAAAVVAQSLAAPTWIILINRMIAVAAIWATALLLQRAGVLETGLRKLQTEADARRAWLAQTLSSIGDGVIACDADARIEFMNTVAEQLTGWDEAHAVGVPVDEVLDLRSEATGEKIIPPVHAALRGPTSSLGEHTLLRCRDGRHWPIDDSAAPIRDDKGTITGAVMVFRDISDRRKAELQTELRLREVGHRIKNIFANVHSILSLCSRTSPTPEELVECVEARLSGLLHSTERLLHATQDGCSLREIVLDEVEPYLDQNHERFRFAGIDVMMDPQAAVSFGMIIHELATNASKHGSLAASAGSVAVTCEHDGTDAILLSWSENGGPPAAPPTRTGMGTMIIDGLVRSQFAGRVDYSYTNDGISCQLELKLPAESGATAAPEPSRPI